MPSSDCHGLPITRVSLAALLALSATTAPDASAAPFVSAPSTCTDPAHPGPWFKALRAEERFCDDIDRPESPWWTALKNRQWGGTRWSFGGEMRLRIEHVDPVSAGLRGGRDDSYAFYRGLLHMDGRLGTHWRVFAEAGYWNSTGREPRPAPTDVDRGDVSQALVEWSPSAATMVRVGRQQVLYGSGRLIGFRGIPNVRQSFDGIRVRHASSSVGVLEVFHFRPVAILPGAFDDREDTGERLFGAYWTSRLPIEGLSIDAYALRFERGFQRYQNAEGPERRMIGGVRLFGQRGRFAMNTELVLQGGEVGTQDARAWWFTSDAQWRSRPQSPWLLGFRTSQASGDSDPNDGRIETYQPMYAPPPYLMQSAFFFPANLRTVQPYLEWAVTPKLTATFEFQAQWRMEESDGYYTPPLVLTRLDDRGTFLGTQAGVSVRYAVRRDLQIDAWVNRLRVSGPLERAGAKDTTFAASMATWSF